MNDPLKIIAELKEEFVELYKILKFEGLVDSGGMAKQIIADGQVIVNGKVETRKRKKIGPGDRIEFSGQSIEVLAKIVRRLHRKPDKYNVESRFQYRALYRLWRRISGQPADEPVPEGQPPGANGSGYRAGPVQASAA